MLSRGRYPVARCWTRIYASFTGQIAAVVELEWCECGLGGRLLGAFDFCRAIDAKNRCVGTQAPCSHRSSSQTRANSPTRIGDPSERDLQARYTGRFCVFQNVDTAPKSSQSVGHACRRSEFCMPRGCLSVFGRLMSPCEAAKGRVPPARCPLVISEEK